jgi:hypothetical protein
VDELLRPDWSPHETLETLSAAAATPHEDCVALVSGLPRVCSPSRAPVPISYRDSLTPRGASSLRVRHSEIPLAAGSRAREDPDTLFHGLTTSRSRPYSWKSRTLGRRADVRLDSPVAKCSVPVRSAGLRRQPMECGSAAGAVFAEAVTQPARSIETSAIRQEKSG